MPDFGLGAWSVDGVLVGMLGSKKTMKPLFLEASRLCLTQLFSPQSNLVDPPCLAVTQRDIVLIGLVK